LGRRLTQSTSGTDAHNPVENEIGVGDQSSNIETRYASDSSPGTDECCGTLSVEGFRKAHSLYRHAPISQMGGGEQGIASVVPRPDKDNHLSPADGPAHLADKTHAPHRKTSGGRLHERALRNPSQHVTLGGANRLDRVEPEHHSTVTDFARLRG
jgi:hypothetical protein